MSGGASKPRLSPFRIFLVLLYALSTAGIAYLFYLGASYYLTPIAERARHPGYWVWKSGGSAGHPLGIAGSGLMTVMLLYSVRKRVRTMRRLGPMSAWLALHIYCGIFGPALVVLHSAFKVQGLVSLSFWSMIAVTLSGVLGRFLYLQIPRTRAGDALSLAELERLDTELTGRLRTEYRLDQNQLRELDAIAAPANAPGLLETLRLLLIDQVRLAGRLRAFARATAVPAPLLGDFRRVVRGKAAARRRIALWDRLHELFHYWHVLHKPFAIVMYLFMVVHIGVAVMTGYGRMGIR